MPKDDSPATVAEPVQSTAVKWLLSQGVSTVLLSCILGFLGYGALKVVPAILEKQDAELKQTRDDFRLSLKEQREDFLEALKRFEEILREAKARNGTTFLPPTDSERAFARSVERISAKGNL